MPMKLRYDSPGKGEGGGQESNRGRAEQGRANTQTLNTSCRHWCRVFTQRLLGPPSDQHRNAMHPGTNRVCIGCPGQASTGFRA